MQARQELVKISTSDILDNIEKITQAIKLINSDSQIMQERLIIRQTDRILSNMENMPQDEMYVMPRNWYEMVCKLISTNQDQTKSMMKNSFMEEIKLNVKSFVSSQFLSYVINNLKNDLNINYNFPILQRLTDEIDADHNVVVWNQANIGTKPFSSTIVYMYQPRTGDNSIDEGDQQDANNDGNQQNDEGDQQDANHDLFGEDNN